MSFTSIASGANLEAQITFIGPLEMLMLYFIQNMLGGPAMEVFFRHLSIRLL
jgi:hypothetical protein